MFATLTDIKDYLEIPQAVTQYDNKLNMILDAGNYKCEKYTGETSTDARLKMSICKYVEYNFNRKTGIESEKDEDFSVKYAQIKGSYSDVPLEVLEIWDDYIDGDDSENKASKADFF